MATPKSTEPTSKKTTAKKAVPAIVAEKPVKKTTKSASTTKTTTRKKAKSVVITSEDRIKMIEVAAYYIAEKHGFGSNHLDHWLQAEQQVDATLNA